MALALDTSETGGACYFLIKNGKPIEASESDLFNEKAGNHEETDEAAAIGKHAMITFRLTALGVGIEQNRHCKAVRTTSRVPIYQKRIMRIETAPSGNDRQWPLTLISAQAMLLSRESHGNKSSN